MIEDEHRVVKFLKWLPAGPTASGGHREKTLVQFIAKDGGTRTVAIEDLTLL
jgi:hypothetical protein